MIYKYMFTIDYIPSICPMISPKINPAYPHV